MKRIISLCTAALLCIATYAQTTTTASSTMTASPWAVRVPYDIADEGQKFNFTTGMGGWSDIQFAYKQRNWVGVDNMKIARLNFFGRNSTSTTLPTSLSAEQTSTGITFNFPDETAGSHNGLDTDLAILAPTGVKNILLLCDMDMRVRLNASDWNNTNRVNYYVNDMALAVKYLEGKGYNVVSVAPFNEPDYNAIGNCGGTASVFNIVAAAMQKNETLRGRVCGPNTLNTDRAVEWYTTMKDNIDVINTHQLSGSFEHLVSFWDTGINAGKRAAADEMHNVMEAMVVMNHGGEYGTWWGYDGVARAEFSRMTSKGGQLAYNEQPSKLAVAGVYQYDNDDNQAKAIIGTSERQAVATSFTFLSKSVLAYYDGYGPVYDYTQEVPGGASGSYQNGQTNAERVINIYTGEDVPIEAANGKYKLVNKASGKVLSTISGSLYDAVRICQYADGTVDNQAWNITPVAMDIGGDYSYHFITNANTSSNTFHLDDLNWSLDEGQEVIAYPGGGTGCEQWHVRYVGEGYYTIINRHSGLCLEARSTAEGANVVQKMVDESAAQLWKLVPADHMVDATAPGAPTGLTATAQSGAIKLTWTANNESDVDAYMVYRYNDFAGIWECVGRKVRGTTFLDNTCRKGQPLRYRIKALDGSYNLSAASAEVTAQTATGNALIAQWTGLSLKDNGPNKMHTVANGVTNTTDTNRPAFSFDGSDDYMKLPYHTGDMKEMTFAAWVKGSSTTAWQRIFDFGNGEDEYLFLTPTNGSAMRFEIKKDGITQGLDATTTLGTGTWKHIAVTIDADKVTIYVNGTENASTTGITLRPSDIAPAMSYLGRSQFDADPAFKGMMSDVRIYNYALTASEVKSISSETISTSGYDITAERIPNIADNVNNWDTHTGKWTTWSSSTEDATNLTSPYVRTSGTGVSDLTKTLTYLPEGQYKLTANVYAYYKGSFITIPRNVQELYINDKKLTIGSATNRTATLREISGSVAADNKLEFGLKITSSSSATNTAMDNVKLIYQGTKAEYIEGIEAITYNMTNEARMLVGKPMNATAANKLSTVVSAVDNALSSYTSKIASGTATPSDVNQWVAAMEDIEIASAVTAAKNSIAAYQALGIQLTTAYAAKATYPREFGNETFETELGEVEQKYNAGGYADNEIDAAVIAVKGITNRYLMADAVALATESNPVDVTFMVSNPSFEGDSYESWTTSPNPGMGYDAAEFWNTNYNIYQTLIGMPAGTYRLQTHAFYRYGYQGDNYTAHNNGTLQRHAKLYVTHSTEGTQMAEVMAISDDPSEDTYWGNWSGEKYDGKPVPNDMQAGAHAIDGCGKYALKNGYNSVDITVSTIGDLTIGAKKETLVGGDWSFFGDFSLYYLGDGEHTLTLDEKSSTLPAIDRDIIYDQVTVSRTMKAGKWNTFVVPFDMAIPEGWEVKALTGSECNGDNISLVFSGAASIQAGVPYMVRVSVAVANIEVENVQVSATLANPSTKHVEFIGVYGAGNVPEGSFFISDNKFYRAADDSNTIKAFRAYFTPIEQAATARALSYRIDGEDGTTGIEETAAEEVTVVGIYTLGGVRINEMQQGVNILRMSDGSVVKVVIK